MSELDYDYKLTKLLCKHLKFQNLNEHHQYMCVLKTLALYKQLMVNICEG